MNYYEELRRFKREYWRQMLAKYPNRRDLVRAAGVNRTQVYQTIRALQVEIPNLRRYVRDGSDPEHPQNLQ